MKSNLHVGASIVDYLKNNSHLGDEPIDIEDLVNIGIKSGPYVLLSVFFHHIEMIAYISHPLLSSETFAFVSQC